MKFVTSDTHFFDAGLMNHPNFAPARQNFFQVEDMNQAIIDAWNKVVSPIDTVYHCGDIGIFYKHGSKEEMLKILKQLHGNIIFVKGNHDSQDFLSIWQPIIIELKINNLNSVFTMLVHISSMIIANIF